MPDARFSLLCSKARFVISETRDSNRLDCQKGLKTRIEPQKLFATVSNGALVLAPSSFRLGKRDNTRMSSAS